MSKRWALITLGALTLLTAGCSVSSDAADTDERAPEATTTTTTEASTTTTTTLPLSEQVRRWAVDTALPAYRAIEEAVEAADGTIEGVTRMEGCETIVAEATAARDTPAPVDALDVLWQSAMDSYAGAGEQCVRWQEHPGTSNAFPRYLHLLRQARSTFSDLDAAVADHL